jgi:hypothetical protein
MMQTASTVSEDVVLQMHWCRAGGIKSGAEMLPAELPTSTKCRTYSLWQMNRENVQTCGSLCVISFFSNNITTHILCTADIQRNKLYIFPLKLREQMCGVLLKNHGSSFHSFKYYEQWFNQ